MEEVRGHLNRIRSEYEDFPQNSNRSLLTPGVCVSTFATVGLLVDLLREPGKLGDHNLKSCQLPPLTLCTTSSMNVRGVASSDEDPAHVSCGFKTQPSILLCCLWKTLLTLRRRTRIMYCTHHSCRQKDDTRIFALHPLKTQLFRSMAP